MFTGATHVTCADRSVSVALTEVGASDTPLVMTAQAGDVDSTASGTINAKDAASTRDGRTDVHTRTSQA